MKYISPHWKYLKENPFTHQKSLKQKYKNYEIGMATLLNAIAITITAFLAVIVMQYLSLPNQLSHTQNYADLAAISAAQMIQNGKEHHKICPQIKELVAENSATKVIITECKIAGENVQIKAEYIKILPFLSRPITAKSNAGPVV